MIDSPEFHNLGTPVAVDVGKVEQELGALWKSASEREGEGAVIRACSCNLVIVARDHREAAALLPLVARVAEWHPCRSLVAYRESGPEGEPPAQAPHMHAWISAQCSVPFAGGPQICSEVITLSADNSAADDLPNTLISLLVPDLPVFLYWRSCRGSDYGLIEQLLRFSQLMIVDSHASKDDPDNRERLLEFLIHPPGDIAVRDLNWSRLTAWRDLTAQFFDNPDSRHLLEEITEVEISRDVAASGNIPTRTLLLTGWLASRLGWKLVSAEKTDRLWVSRWRSGTGEVLVRFTGDLAVAGERPGISSVRLRTRGGASFQVVGAKSSSHLTATASGQRPEMVHSVPREAVDEPTLLARELSISGRDAGFQSALEQALALEKCFH